MSYNNPESLENLVSGYRDVKIDFVNQNGLETTVFDSSLDLTLPKLLVGKAFQPGDTHVGLNMAVNEGQIIDNQDISKVVFTIETDNGISDNNDQLFLLNNDDQIAENLSYSKDQGQYLKLEWLPEASLNNSQIISQLKDKIGFGGDFIEQSGLRTIQVDIFNIDNELIGPNDLKTTVFVQEDVNQTIIGTKNGQVANITDNDGEGNEDIVSYAQYAGQEKLTIDIGFETVKTTSDNNLTSLNEVSGFEGVIGSSKDDIIIGGNNENKIAGAAGEDLISGDNDDFVDYGREQHLLINHRLFI